MNLTEWAQSIFWSWGRTNPALDAYASTCSIINPSNTFSGVSWTTEAKDRCNGKGGGEVEPGDLGNDDDLNGKVGDEAVAAEEDDGDELGTAAGDEEDGETGLVTITEWVDASIGERTLVDPELAHNDLKRRTRWPSP
jgi:hypothetical protein